jgi:hypothetical protein
MTGRTAAKSSSFYRFSTDEQEENDSSIPPIEDTRSNGHRPGVPLNGSLQADTAYSYIRFSSRKQEEGDSIRRQIEGTREWAKHNRVHLDTSLQIDKGISAFRGKNRDLGSLAAFLRLVENGRVIPGSYLVVEALDRLTREEIQPALLLILNLLQKGHPHCSTQTRGNGLRPQERHDAHHAHGRGAVPRA